MKPHYPVEARVGHCVGSLVPGCLPAGRINYSHPCVVSLRMWYHLLMEVWIVAQQPGTLKKNHCLWGSLSSAQPWPVSPCRCRACLVLVKPGWGHSRMLLEMSRGLACGCNAISTALASIFSLQTFSTSLFVQEWHNWVSSLIHENYGMRIVLGRQRKVPVESTWYRNDTCMCKGGVYMWRHAHVVACVWWSEDTIRTWFSPSALLRQGSSCFSCDVCERLVNPHHLGSSFSASLCALGALILWMGTTTSNWGIHAYVASAFTLWNISPAIMSALQRGRIVNRSQGSELACCPGQIMAVRSHLQLRMVV